MKFYSWNVNGIRACSKKEGFWEWFLSTKADFIAFQETKASPEQLEQSLLNPEDYLSYWCSSTVKKGYSGVGVYSLPSPLNIKCELEDKNFQGEGRLLHLEFPKFHFYNIYFPNGQQSEERLQYKLGFYEAFLKEAEKARKTKPIIVCGDFNTAHREIDIARPKANENTSGFLAIERAWLDKFTSHGYYDTLRLVNKNKDLYSWWSMRTLARQRNVGWRIDYFFVSAELKEAVTNAWIETEVFGSDHAPIGLEINL